MELVLHNLNKKYGKKIAIHPTNLTLTPGIYGFLGPNGAGKTTLMNMIADCLHPSGGTILWNGESIWSLDEKYRACIGYLPQNAGMYSSFTAYEMLAYFASLRGLTNRLQIHKNIELLLEKVNLLSEAETKISKFSGGMKQRLGIAQALIGNPDLLILDEPTAGLDPGERIRFKNYIKESSSNRIILYATHIISDLEELAHRVFFIKNGNLSGDYSLPAETTLDNLYIHHFGIVENDHIV